jgi:hypothetical protein
MSHRNRSVPAPAGPTFLEKFGKCFTDYGSDQILEMSERLYTSVLELYTSGRPFPMNTFEASRLAMDNFRMWTSFAVVCVRRMEETHGKDLEEMGYILQRRKPYI